MIENYLSEDWKNNPRSEMLYRHSMLVADAACIIADRCGMDAERARVYGEMHDVGKFGLKEHELYKHCLNGYEMLKSDHPDIAMICLTHPFLTTEYERILSFCKNDKEEADKIYQIIKDIKFDDYIKLIQLCDKVSSYDRYVTIKQKMQWYQEKQRLSIGLLDKRFARLYMIKAKLDRMAKVDTYFLLKLSVAENARKNKVQRY